MHKYYNIIKDNLHSKILLFYALELVASEIIKQNYTEVYLLATKNTIEDGFFTKKLEQYGIEVTIPNEKERNEIHKISDISEKL